eukprot:GHUV01017056.1.p1 GENE.GHUV01017056.1~~GHUV01017056.1.p1  ORF type:complete len:163 (+),score=32.61 GHUV01017056.1:1370-1858(+)
MQDCSQQWGNAQLLLLSPVDVLQALVASAAAVGPSNPSQHDSHPGWGHMCRGITPVMQCKDTKLLSALETTVPCAWHERSRCCNSLQKTAEVTCYVCEQPCLHQTVPPSTNQILSLSQLSNTLQTALMHVLKLDRYFVVWLLQYTTAPPTFSSSTTSNQNVL